MFGRFLAKVFGCAFLVLAGPAPAGERSVLVLGDSLSAGYGMNIEQGWVSLLQKRLDEQGYNYDVINASISGDTSKGALARMDLVLKENPPDIGIVELGGNDGLRGLPLKELRQNLDAIIARLKAAGTSVLLLPMKLPPNYGPAYTRGFEAIYAELAEAHGAGLGDFILEDIALRKELMQEDGIHPRAEAQPLIVDRVWKLLEPLLTHE